MPVRSVELGSRLTVFETVFGPCDKFSRQWNDLHTVSAYDEQPSASPEDGHQWRHVERVILMRRY